MNAFVLAGDRGASHQICGMNKAFLILEGHPILVHVLMVLDQVRDIEKVYIIGPRGKIMEAIEKALPQVFFIKRIEVLEQRNSLLENILYMYAYSLPGYREGLDSRELADADQPALFLPADIPLVTAAEIEEFISGSDMKKYDYCLGVTPEESLAPFYPQPGKPGIKMAYLYLKDKAYRMNNLHLARPYRIGAAGYVQKMYDHRYQKYIGNRIQIAREILKTSRWTKGVFLYLMAQGAAFFSQIGLTSIASLFRQFLTVEAVEREVSSFLKTRFKSVETHMGGAALDVDDEATYRVVSLLFREWRATLAQFDKRQEKEALCPFKPGTCRERF